MAQAPKNSRRSETISLSDHHRATIPPKLIRLTAECYLKKLDGESGPLSDGGLTAGELLRELERAIEAELAGARAKLAELMRGAVAGYVRRAYVNCGKPGCHKCPHGPYPQFKEPGGNWRIISEDEYAKLLVATERWREARRVERQIERAERLWLRARELLDEVLSILEVLSGGDGYGEDV